MFSSFPAQLPSLFFEPRRYRAHGIGYWSGHIPFACDLIHTLRPETFVELGTHAGESYFTFCQAIQESAISCQAFAVDTWRGDQHTGAYSDDIFAEVSKCNERYRSFSKLLRMTFDEAGPQFADESIDLLHIDGAHTYDAVRHDFERWWPKVRNGGVVVMHDSFERGHDFGVWRFLEELRNTLPAEEFTHSHGLAVVCKQPSASRSNVATEFVTAPPEKLQAMRRYYETCAAGLTRRFLLARPRGAWDVNAQLFWRGDGESFSEAESVRAAEVVDTSGTRILLPIPKRSQRCVEFRIVPTLEPALLLLESLAIEDAAGQQLLSLTGAELFGFKDAGNLQASVTQAGLALFSKSGTNAFTLPIPPLVRERLHTNGGRVNLRLMGTDPFALARELANGAVRPEPEKRSLLARLVSRT